MNYSGYYGYDYSNHYDYDDFGSMDFSSDFGNGIMDFSGYNYDSKESGSTVENKSCVFPFKIGDGIDRDDRYYNEKNYGCLPITIIHTGSSKFQTWCATEVDKDGIIATLEQDGNNWGFCDPDCPTHEESLTWRKDETFKMTLQYDNPLLWTGLEFYGILFAIILLYSLILTAVPSAIGTMIGTISHSIFQFINSSHDDWQA